MKRLIALALMALAIFVLMPPKVAHAEFSEDTEDLFTIVWLSDTQDMAYHDYNGALHKMGKWIIAQKENLDIRYVVQTGDMVDNGAAPKQWERFDEMYNEFKDDIPYISAAGNHEIKKNGYFDYYMRPEVRSIPRSNTYMRGKSSFCTLEVNGCKIIIVAIGNEVEQESAPWVNEVLRLHRDYAAILLVHDYLWQGARYGVNGKWVFENIVKTNSNVRMVLSGHVHNTSARIDLLDDDNDGVAERQVVQMMYNYQHYNTDCGQLRTLQFNTQEHSLTVTTYSPVTDKYYKEFWFGNEETFTVENAF